MTRVQKKGSLIAVGDGLLVDQWKGGVNPKTVEPVKNIIIIADASIVHFMNGVAYATRALRGVQNDHAVKMRREKTQFSIICMQNIMDLRAWALIKRDKRNKLVLYNYYLPLYYLVHVYNC